MLAMCQHTGEGAGVRKIIVLARGVIHTLPSARHGGAL